MKKFAIVFLSFTALLFATNAFAQSSETKKYQDTIASYCSAIASMKCIKLNAPYYQYLNQQAGLRIDSLPAFMEYCKRQKHDYVCHVYCNQNQYCNSGSVDAYSLCMNKCFVPLRDLWLKTPEYAEQQRRAKQEAEERAKEQARLKIENEQREAELEHKRQMNAQKRQMEEVAAAERARIEKEHQMKESTAIMKDEITQFMTKHLDYSLEQCSCSCRYSSLVMLPDTYHNFYTYVSLLKELHPEIKDTDDCRSSSYDICTVAGTYNRTWTKEMTNEVKAKLDKLRSSCVWIDVCDAICSDAISKTAHLRNAKKGGNRNILKNLF